MGRDEKEALEILRYVDRSIVPLGKLKVKRAGRGGEEIVVSSIIPDLSDYKKALISIMEELDLFKKEIVSVRTFRFLHSSRRKLRVSSGKNTFNSFSVDGSAPLVDPKVLVELNRYRGQLDGYRRQPLPIIVFDSRPHLQRRLL
jgi:hypothetical protein